MSEPHAHDEHQSFIKTPRQLAIVIVLAFVVPVLLISIIASLATRSVTPEPVASSDEAVAKRLKPVGEVVVVEGSDQPGQRSGKEIVDSVCAACHTTGLLNAPKIGDTAAWAPLIKQGLKQLTEVAIKGIRQMPPRGGNPELTDVEVARAVAYLANQSGAKFEEPAAPKEAPVQTAAAAAPAAAAPASTGKPATAPAAGAADSAAAKSASADSAAGKSTYDKACTVCHATGVAGAPKAGDKDAWAPRLKQGTNALYESALKGKGAMPPKGGNTALPDADVKAAVDYMVSLVK
jgi:cytochrome c5